MCRHLAHLGSPIPLRTPLFEAPHSLCRQSVAARRMVVADHNPDGWGVAWYQERPEGSTAGAAPTLLRTVAPMDNAGPDALAGVRAGTFVAAARLASPGTALDVRNNAPLVDGMLAFSLNGFVFTDGREQALRDAVPRPFRAAISGDADSHVLFALTRAAVAGGATLGEALRAVHAHVAPDDHVRMNLLVSDGTAVAATAWRHSLFTRCTARTTQIASEPLDAEPGWAEVPDRSLLTATSGAVTVAPL